MRKIFFIIGGVLIVLALVYFGVMVSQKNSEQTGTAFEETGNLAKDNPGFTPGVWYLVYESAGNPALSQALKFSGSSICAVNGVDSVCDPDSFMQGAKATVSGTLSGSMVSVIKLTFASNTSSDKSDLIQVTSPASGATVTSPLTVTGKARGTWFFEASFPVKLFDGNGEQIAVTTAHAEGDWMTEEFVPFTATLTFAAPTTTDGVLMLQKDNPSGLPQNEDELQIPIKFSTAPTELIKLYYYDANKDKDGAGNVLCSRAGLVAVDRTIPVTQTPIQDSIKLLLQGQLTEAEKASGVTTGYPLSGFVLKGASLTDGSLKLEFTDPQNQTSGGSCRANVLWYQIEATAKQFSGVTSVSFIPDTLFQP